MSIKPHSGVVLLAMYSCLNMWHLCSPMIRYVVVVRGDEDVNHARRQLDQWLSLVRSGMSRSGCSVEARIVVTHTETLTDVERRQLTRDLFAHACSAFGGAFRFGQQCYITDYTRADGGGVDALRTELRRLRDVAVPQRPMPSSYQALGHELLEMARGCRQWPVKPAAEVESGDNALALACLQDLGYLLRVGNSVVLDPVTWLSRLMSSFVHPFYGVTRVDSGGAMAATHHDHMSAVLVNVDEAHRVVNMIDAVVDADQKHSVLELLAAVDVCFRPGPEPLYVEPPLFSTATRV